MIKCFILTLLFTSITQAQLGNPHYAWLPMFFNGPEYVLNVDELVLKAKESTDPLVFLDDLVQSYPQLKTTFTLIYDSQSIQRANKENPRILFFTPNGVFFSLSTFADSKSLEVISFEKESKRFSFKEIIFNEDEVTVHAEPKKCFSCHAGKPIWENYFTWPGAFGSKDDYVFEGRLDDFARVEREEFKNYVENYTNPYLKILGLDSEDYFFDESKSGKDYLFSPLRRNSYLLYHLGYYNYLTLMGGVSDYYSANMSFLKERRIDFGGDGPRAMAARTMLIGLEDNPIHRRMRIKGNNIDKSSLKIPIIDMDQYNENYSLLRSTVPHGKRSAIAKCVSCHREGTDNAPYIPFHNVIEFKDLISNSRIKDKILYRISEEARGTSKQMPPKSPLDLVERESVISFLEELD